MTGCPTRAARSPVFSATATATSPPSVRWPGLPGIPAGRSACPRGPAPCLGMTVWPRCTGLQCSLRLQTWRSSENLFIPERVGSGLAARTWAGLCSVSARPTRGAPTVSPCSLRARPPSQPGGTASGAIVSSVHHRVHRNRTLRAFATADQFLKRQERSPFIKNT